MEEVEKIIPIWPPIQEQHRHCSKVDTERDLDYIGKAITGTTRPLVTLEPPMQGRFVAKRSEFYSPENYMLPDTKQDIFQWFLSMSLE